MRLAIAVLLLVVSGFFLVTLFYGEMKLFATPDFGQSDIWSLNLPAKFFLSESLKRGELPLWNKDIGTGYPMLAEGQIGAFFPVNLLLFRLLPFFLAWNLGYLVTFLTSSLGTFLYLRALGVRILIATFAALVYSFSGSFSVHLSHYNLIQALSLLPWLFFFLESALSGRRWGYPLLSIAITIQLFAGFPQISLISLMGISWYFFWRAKVHQFSAVAFKRLLPLAFFLTVSFFLAGIQLAPQFELLQSSVRGQGLSYEQTVYFSYPWKHLATLVDPFILGDPRRGTYPPFAEFDGSIFWENTPYVGIVALSLALISLVFLGKSRIMRVYWLTALLALLLMTGKYSPLYFFYSFPPLTFFRVPSRFSALFVWSLVSLAALGFNTLMDRLSKLSRKLTLLAVLLLGILGASELLRFAISYNPVVPVSQFSVKLEVLETISLSKRRIYTFGSEYPWNKIFFKDGWSNLAPYLYLRNGMTPNSNILYGVAHVSLYPPLLTRRLDTISKIYQGNIYLTESLATISATGLRFLQLANTGYVVTPMEVKSRDLRERARLQPNPVDLPAMRVYELETTYPRVFITSEATSAATVNELINHVWRWKDTTPPLVLETTPQPLPEKVGEKSTVNILRDEHQTLVVEAKSETDGYLVVADSYYPGWTANIDGKEVKILPANINSRAIILPPGSHTVTFRYQPKSLVIGVFLSLIGIGLWVVGTMFVYGRRQFNQKFAIIT